MNREQLLHWISLTKFACVDANLYLDTHPWDLEAIRYFQEHMRLYNEAMKEYAKSYGPLTLTHAHHCDSYWDWVNQPWPWQ
ncbi:MAG: spore coat protein CotJB [Lachnospiraceae bacterium]|nr:spore coat protein CotJB [Lachnospiraceae bacterium]